MKTKKQRWQASKNEKMNRQKLNLIIDDEDKKEVYVYNPEDIRFKPVFTDPKFSIDPSNPKFDHRKTGAVFK